MTRTSNRSLIWVVVTALMLTALACTCGPLADLTGQVESQLEEVAPTSAVIYSTAASDQAEESADDIPEESAGTGAAQGDYDGAIFDGGDGYETTVAQWYAGLTSGTFASLFEAHNYAFEAQSGDSVRIEVVGSNEVDTRLKLIDPEGNVLEEVDDLDGSTDPVIQVDSLPASGVYTARIDTWDEGSYEIGIYLNGEIPAGSSGGQPTTGGVVQWATAATASSEYGSDSWSAMQATGAPDTDGCGDIETAWASETSTGDDWLRLTYDEAVIPTRIEIYETFNPGSIVQVDVTNTQEGGITTVYFDFSQKPTPDCPRVMVIEVTDVVDPIDQVTIFLDQTDHTGWNEIDAVALISQ